MGMEWPSKTYHDALFLYPEYENGKISSVYARYHRFCRDSCSGNVEVTSVKKIVLKTPLQRIIEGFKAEKDEKQNFHDFYAPQISVLMGENINRLKIFLVILKDDSITIDNIVAHYTEELIEIQPQIGSKN
ncbi:hypothetical protein HY501_01015 [Candidatus Woesearchaeota archaeon]|nr:hypothetical protein [Candidatus Woesearchaeota archaeon]